MYESQCPECKTAIFVDTAEGYSIELQCAECLEVLHLEKTNGSKVLSAKKKPVPVFGLLGGLCDFELHPVTEAATGHPR